MTAPSHSAVTRRVSLILPGPICSGEFDSGDTVCAIKPIAQSCLRPSIQCSCGIEIPLHASLTCAMFLAAKQRQIVQPKIPPFGLPNGLPEAGLFRELLVPLRVEFVTQDWETVIGTKWSLRAVISSITSIVILADKTHV